MILRHGSIRKSFAWLAVLISALVLIAWQLGHPVVRTIDDDDKLGAPLAVAPYDDWAAVEYLYRGSRVRFERDGAGHWFRHDRVAGETVSHVHSVDPAAAERISSVLAAFSRTRVERTLVSNPARLADLGLVNPALVVLIQNRDGRVLQTIELGEVAPDQLSRYVQLPQTHQVHTIANFHAIALLSLLAPK